METSTDVRLRRASGADASAVATVNAVVQSLHARALPDEFLMPDHAAAQTYFEDRLAQSSSVVLLAESAGEACGYLYAEELRPAANPFKAPTPTLYINHLAVVPHMQGQGIGRQLVLAAEKHARQCGIDLVRLDAWSFNETALRTFASLGYEPYNVRMQHRLEPRL